MLFCKSCGLLHNGWKVLLLPLKHIDKHLLHQDQYRLLFSGEVSKLNFVIVHAKKHYSAQLLCKQLHQAYSYTLIFNEWQSTTL